jgi:hypothetical protein
MNVQQINDTGHNMWAFIFTSIVLLTISALSFLFRHSMKHLMERLKFGFSKHVLGPLEPSFLILKGLVELIRSAVSHYRRER